MVISSNHLPCILYYCNGYFSALKCLTELLVDTNRRFQVTKVYSYILHKREIADSQCLTRRPGSYGVYVK